MSRYLGASVLLLNLLAACQFAAPIPAETVTLMAGIERLENPNLAIFANGLDGLVLAADGRVLVELSNGGRREQPLHQFDDPIVGIHTTPSGVILVSTDRDHWDPATPCNVFASRDRGQSFEASKTIDGGCAIWFSFASNAAGTIFLGEYGPRQIGMSKTVWRSRDAGRSWKAVFEASANDMAHIHRVAVDPVTDRVWVTVGDSRRNRGIYYSPDEGEHWSLARVSQATAVAFTADGIYWGEDIAQGEIDFSPRGEPAATKVLQVSHLGNYGGSVYALAQGRSGRIYAPFMRYAGQQHTASLWGGSGHDWQLLMTFAPAANGSVNVPTIAGPDRDGWLYVGGYRIPDWTGTPAKRL